MTLNEILEEYSVKSISQKTMISEENIENIVEEKFSTLAKAKTLGFISIIEREFNVDLTTLKEKALLYYESYGDAEESVNIALPQVEGKRGRSKWFPLFILALLAYASWYFFTQFDKKTFSTILPFTEDKIEVENPQNIDVVPQEEIKVKDEETKKEEPLSINTAFTSINDTTVSIHQTRDLENDNIKKPAEEISTVVSVAHGEVETHALEVESVVPQKAEVIALMPESRLWFGIVDMRTGKRRHTSISDKYEIDVKDKSWLVATSPAPFSFINQNKIQKFNDAKAHYFKVSSVGIEMLSKTEYVSRGGYRKW